MSIITNIVIGALIGVLLGSVNNYLLYIVVQKSLTIDKDDPKRMQKARLILYLSLFARMLSIVIVFFLVFKLLGQTILLASCAGLAIVTLVSPYKKYYRQQGQKKQ